MSAPVNLLSFSQKCQGVLFFPDLTQLITFSAASLVLTPFVHNQGDHFARECPQGGGGGGKGKGGGKSVDCFICGGPHFARECPEGGGGKGKGGQRAKRVRPIHTMPCHTMQSRVWL